MSLFSEMQNFKVYLVSTRIIVELMSLSVTDSYQFSPLVLSLGHPTRQLISPATKVFESFNLALLTSPIGSKEAGNESDSFN